MENVAEEPVIQSETPLVEPLFHSINGWPSAEVTSAGLSQNSRLSPPPGPTSRLEEAGASRKPELPSKLKAGPTFPGIKYDTPPLLERLLVPMTSLRLLLPGHQLTIPEGTAAHALLSTVKLATKHVTAPALFETTTE